MKNYPEHYKALVSSMKQLGVEIPDTMKAFSQLHKSGIAEGALSKTTKELIALGIAIAVRCDGCIAFHVNDALKAGASRAEIAETIGVAIMMGGGPSAVYGCEAFEALKQFEAKQDLAAV